MYIMSREALGFINLNSHLHKCVAVIFALKNDGLFPVCVIVESKHPQLMCT